MVGVILIGAATGLAAMWVLDFLLYSIRADPKSSSFYRSIWFLGGIAWQVGFMWIGGLAAVVIFKLWGQQ